MEFSASRRLSAGPTAAHEARAALEPLRGELGEELFADVKLIASELVTNAYRHSGAPDAPIGLEIEVCADRVHGEVTDGGPGFSTEPVPQDRRGIGGWGLHIADSLSDRWGVRAGPPTRVWFEIGRELSSRDSRPPEAPRGRRGDPRVRSPRATDRRPRRP